MITRWRQVSVSEHKHGHFLPVIIDGNQDALFNYLSVSLIPAMVLNYHSSLQFMTGEEDLLTVLAATYVVPYNYCIRNYTDIK